MRKNETTLAFASFFTAVLPELRRLGERAVESPPPLLNVHPTKKIKRNRLSPSSFLRYSSQVLDGPLQGCGVLVGLFLLRLRLRLRAPARLRLRLDDTLKAYSGGVGNLSTSEIALIIMPETQLKRMTRLCLLPAEYDSAAPAVPAGSG